MTGPLSGFKAGVIAYELWRDDVNAAGGILGRPVELVIYDDQSNAALVPGIYSKLVDIDKVDFLFSPYGANLTATIMPFLKQRDLFCVGMFGLANNDVVKHDKFFQIAPWGPDATTDWARGFFDIAHQRNFKKIAIVAADAEFPRSAAEGAVKIIKEYGMQTVLSQTYPLNTNDFSSVLRNIKAAAPEIVFACTYPPDGAAMVRGLSEVGIGDSVQLFGGGLVGLQYASLLESLGSSLNGIVNFHTYVPEPTLDFPGIKHFLSRYEVNARAKGVDSLGHQYPTFTYAAGQVVSNALNKIGTVDRAKLAQYLHAEESDTIVGKIRFDAIGNWTKRRVLMVQFQGVKDKDLDQFRFPGRQVVIDPPEFRSGEFKHPFSKARG